MLIELRENHEEITEITNEAATILVEDYSIQLAKNSVAIPTIAYAYMASAVQYISSIKPKDAGIEVDFGDFFRFGISHNNVEAEKDGNYVPYVEVGSIPERMINGDKTIVKPEIAEEYKEILDRIADDSVEFLRKRFEIKFEQQTNVVPTITLAFMQAAVIYLEENKVEDGGVEINMFQLFDMGVMSVEEGYKLFVIPGTDMKLIVKDDGSTEEDM